MLCYFDSRPPTRLYFTAAFKPLSKWVERDAGLEDLYMLTVIAGTVTNNHQMAVNTFRLKITRFIASGGMIFELGSQQMFCSQYPNTCMLEHS